MNLNNIKAGDHIVIGRPSKGYSFERIVVRVNDRQIHVCRPEQPDVIAETYSRSTGIIWGFGDSPDAIQILDIVPRQLSCEEKLAQCLEWLERIQSQQGWGDLREFLEEIKS